MNNLPVLVVDDSEINLAITEAQCQELGIECVLRDSGESALAAVADQAFSLILTDISMPGMDGAQLCHAIRNDQSQEIASLPIVAVTTNVTETLRSSMRDDGFNDVLERPVEVNTLSQLIERWCNDGETFSSSSKESNISGGPIDFELLPALLGTDEQDRLIEWLQLFIRLFPENLSAVEAAANNRKADLLREKAHKAKGAARSAAAKQLADLMGEIEQMSAEPDWPVIEAGICAATEAFENLIKSVDSLVDT